MKWNYLRILFIIYLFELAHSSCECGVDQNVSASSIASVSVGSPSEGGGFGGVSCAPIICSTTILFEDNLINGLPAGATVKILPCQNLSDTNTVTLLANQQTFNSCQSDAFSFSVTDTNVFTFVFKIQTPVFFYAVLQPAPQPTVLPSTSEVPCETLKINQDICLIYDVSQIDDDISDTVLHYDIWSSLFNPSLYSFKSFHPVPVPFPRTSDFAAADAIPFLFSNVNTVEHYQATINIQTTLSSYFTSTQSLVNDALTYLIANPLQRRPNVAENMIIVAKNTNYIDEATMGYIRIFKNSGMTILTIGIGNSDFSKLFRLATSTDYTFTIFDLTNYNNVTKVVNSIAAKLCTI